MKPLWMAFLTGGVLFACDTWVALPNATADRSVILAKNSDRPPMEAQPLVHAPAGRYPAGDTVQCTYIRIPQAAETYEHIGSKVWWAFGYEHGMNQHGVAIGNEAVWSKEPYQWNNGLLGMDLVRLGLERGKTAREAMHVIASLLEKHGQSGDAERPGEWGKANYHNSFVIADTTEAWVLETAGRYWVAKRLTSGVYSISNIYSIETEWDEAHPRLVEHAIEMGWTKSRETFNFARDYGDYWRKDSKGPGDMQIRRNTTLSCLNRDARRITPASMMKISRSHMEGTLTEPRWSASEPFWATPCMHDTPRSGYHTAASMVAHLRPHKPALLRQVYWASFSNPCCNVFRPLYLNGPAAGAELAKGTSTYSEDSPWWWANRVKLLCDLNHPALAPQARERFDTTEDWQWEHLPQVEAEAERLLAAGKPSQAVSTLQRFMDANSARIASEYRRLGETLPALLQQAGTRYLYREYMREWTAKSQVPLP